jgi:hypothetical protein
MYVMIRKVKGVKLGRGVIFRIFRILTKSTGDVEKNGD